MAGSKGEIKTHLTFLIWLVLICISPGAMLHAAAEPRIIGEIDIHVADIYDRQELGASNGMMRLVKRGMNLVHASTQQHIIRRELLFDVDDPVSRRLMAETERNLRDLGFLTEVSVAVGDTLADGRVVVHVRVQKTWSLTTQLSYSKSSGDDHWTALISDRNFMGHGVSLVAGLGENEDRSFRILSFGNRRLRGLPLRMDVSYVDQTDGYSKRMIIDKPYYTDDTRWGIAAVTWSRLSEPRFYLDGCDLSSMPRTRPLYAKIPTKDNGFDLSVSGMMSRRQRGTIIRAGTGVHIMDVAMAVPAEIELSDGSLVAGSLLETTSGGALIRESGLHIQPYVMAQILGRRWAKARHILRLGPVEDLNLDPRVTLRAGLDLTRGNDGFELIDLDTSYLDWSRLGGGFLLTSGNLKAAIGDSGNRNHSLDLLVGWIRPFATDNVSRVFLEAAHGHQMLGSEAFVLGLERGLRTLEYDGMVGDRLLRWNAEQMKILPGELLGFYKVGVGVFYGAGLSWWQDQDCDIKDIRHEAGVGLRFGPTRSSRAEITRLDLTWPLGSRDAKITATTSGRF